MTVLCHSNSVQFVNLVLRRIFHHVLYHTEIVLLRQLVL